MGDGKNGKIIGKVTKKHDRSKYDVLIGQRPHPYSQLFYGGSDELAVGQDVVVSFLGNDDQKPFISGRPNEAWANVPHETTKICHVVGFKDGFHNIATLSDQAMSRIPVDQHLSCPGIRTSRFSWGFTVLVAFKNGSSQQPYIWGISPWYVGQPDHQKFPPE